MTTVFPFFAENHDPRLLTGAVIFCLLACSAGFIALKRASGDSIQSYAWIAVAALAVGIGTTTASLIGVLGCASHIPVIYYWDELLLAMLPAVMNTGLGFAVISREKSSSGFGGVFLGTGMAMMHYTAFSAIGTNGVVTWNWALVAVSSASAVLCGAAAGIVYQLRVPRRALYCAMLVCVGVIAQHFVGMAALDLQPATDSSGEFTPVMGWASLQKVITALSLVMAAALFGVLLLDRKGMSQKVREASELKRLADELMAGSAERERLLGQLTRQYEITSAAFDNMAHGLTMYDGSNRLVVWNRRYLEMFNVPEDFLVPGMPASVVRRHYFDNGLIEGTSEDYARTHIASMSRVIAPRMINLRDGRVVEIHGRRLQNGGWITTHEDVTERERLLEELKQQNTIATAALDNMVHGLTMYDDHDRLITMNRRYVEMFDVPEGAIRMGMTHLEIVKFHIDAGQVPEYFLPALQQGLSPASRDFEFTFSDGRIFEVNRRPMQAGGWVLTYEDVTSERAARDRISYLATHDELTGLPNRRTFAQALTEAVASRGEAGTFALLTIDLDRFKDVNDTLGHPVGDQILKETAARLKALVGATGMITRLGGDEFAILMLEGAAKEADQLADRVIQSLSQPYEFQDHTISVGATVGIAMAQDCDADELVKRSDLALYRAKNHSRGSHCFFEHGMDGHLLARRELEMGLRVALQRGEFELYYQPLLNVASQAIAGFEALLRWNHPTRGLLLPAEFITTAEESGLIIPIGEWVLRHACKHAAEWPESVQVSVNLSAAQLKRGDLLAMTKSALGAAGLPAHRLQIELTESVLLHDEEWVRALLLQLRDLGISIAMDDFGTGYSSLSYLRTFPFNKIKIDKSFVSDLEQNADALAIVQATIGLSRKLGMCTTAEGVETAEQLEMLTAEGCTEIQGYRISPPVPAAEVWPLLERHGMTRDEPLKAAS